mmetsp:Transcript_7006/g.17017  ORF Transcript_7006/g.17017 Transcript_7006/m.17017 type:complete len:274 (+) Transcript_7006:1375-2196(+)
MCSVSGSEANGSWPPSIPIWVSSSDIDQVEYSSLISNIFSSNTSSGQNCTMSSSKRSTRICISVFCIAVLCSFFFATSMASARVMSLIEKNTPLPISSAMQLASSRSMMVRVRTSSSTILARISASAWRFSSSCSLPSSTSFFSSSRFFFSISLFCFSRSFSSCSFNFLASSLFPSDLSFSSFSLICFCHSFFCFSRAFFSSSILRSASSRCTSSLAWKARMDRSASSSPAMAPMRLLLTSFMASSQSGIDLSTSLGSKYTNRLWLPKRILSL